jgi:hypothetical protein
MGGLISDVFGGIGGPSFGGDVDEVFHLVEVTWIDYGALGKYMVNRF